MILVLCKINLNWAKISKLFPHCNWKLKFILTIKSHFYSKYTFFNAGFIPETTSARKENVMHIGFWEWEFHMIMLNI